MDRPHSGGPMFKCQIVGLLRSQEPAAPEDYRIACKAGFRKTVYHTLRGSRLPMPRSGASLLDRTI